MNNLHNHPNLTGTTPVDRTETPLNTAENNEGFPIGKQVPPKDIIDPNKESPPTKETSPLVRIPNNDNLNIKENDNLQQSVNKAMSCTSSVFRAKAAVFFKTCGSAICQAAKFVWTSPILLLGSSKKALRKAHDEILKAAQSGSQSLSNVNEGLAFKGGIRLGAALGGAFAVITAPLVFAAVILVGLPIAGIALLGEKISQAIANSREKENNKDLQNQKLNEIIENYSLIKEPGLRKSGYKFYLLNEMVKKLQGLNNQNTSKAEKWILRAAKILIKEYENNVSNFSKQEDKKAFINELFNIKKIIEKLKENDEVIKDLNGVVGGFFKQLEIDSLELNVNEGFKNIDFIESFYSFEKSFYPNSPFNEKAIKFLSDFILDYLKVENPNKENIKYFSKAFQLLSEITQKSGEKIKQENLVELEISVRKYLKKIESKIKEVEDLTSLEKINSENYYKAKKIYADMNLNYLEILNKDLNSMKEIKEIKEIKEKYHEFKPYQNVIDFIKSPFSQIISSSLNKGDQESFKKAVENVQKLEKINKETYGLESRKKELYDLAVKHDIVDDFSEVKLWAPSQN